LTPNEGLKNSAVADGL